ncbi:putative periodic tryptophan protein PWP2 [Testicularia cyperi]|uniref:Putative periodic tryptophan protein PWP2 n=1 Tax=Testicularia cyperi TaxID=1882483 RepID=A0A317XV78_9BASI|nr:putative periodic tryptophan protein PWP2 [Testicularia cyperi]
MKSSFKFSNLCGTVYQGGNVVFSPDGDSIYSPVGNRLSIFDLVRNTSTTLPFETRKPIARIALSPANKAIVLVADEDGRALLINVLRRSLLAHMNFKQPLRDAQFSNDGKFLAVTYGNQIKVWRTPSHLAREFAPFVLHRTFTGHFDDVLSIRWTQNSRFFITTSKDMTARLYSVDPVEGFRPKTFTGHRDAVLGAYFSKDERTIYTVSRDGACFTWRGKRSEDEDDDDMHEDEEDAMDAALARLNGSSSKQEQNAVGLTRWGIAEKHYFMQTGSKTVCASFHQQGSLLVVGFSNGIFGLYEMPDFNCIHTLSISQEKITSVAINASGEWLAFGATHLGQLLVWEWASESYILKQQGHYYDMNTVGFASDGAIAATGGDDGKIKLWNTSSGFCTATFAEHSASVSCIEFAKQGQVLFSASLDGTVRAYDLVRYRNFRTLTSPEPVQFTSLAVDPSGEVVCAGSADTFEIYMWSVQTGKLLEILSGHEGPVSGLAFSPDGSGTLASVSWDKTVRTWEVFRTSQSVETFSLNADGLAVAFRPDGREICATSLDGYLAFFDVKEGKQTGMVECRRDISGGRKMNDKITRRNNASGACFTTVCYSADGACVLAGGNSNYVCLYDVKERVLLKRWELTKNLALDGTQDKLDSRRVTDAGAIDLVDDREDEADLLPSERVDRSLPGAQRGDATKRTTRQVSRAKCVRFAPTGRSWAAASTSGLLIYSLDEAAAFDPLDLDMDLTPQAVREASRRGESLLAIVGACRLGERPLMAEVYEQTSADDILLVSQQLPLVHLPTVLRLIAERMQPSSASPHVEFHLRWLAALFSVRGTEIRAKSATDYAATLRAVQVGLNELRANVKRTSDENLYSLLYVWNGITNKPRPSPAQVSSDAMQIEAL